MNSHLFCTYNPVNFSISSFTISLKSRFYFFFPKIYPVVYSINMLILVLFSTFPLSTTESKGLFGLRIGNSKIKGSFEIVRGALNRAGKLKITSSLVDAGDGFPLDCLLNKEVSYFHRFFLWRNLRRFHYDFIIGCNCFKYFFGSIYVTKILSKNFSILE